MISESTHILLSLSAAPIQFRKLLIVSCGRGRPKYKMQILHARIDEGEGLNIPDIKIFDVALEPSYLRRLESETAEWSVFPR